MEEKEVSTVSNNASNSNKIRTENWLLGFSVGREVIGDSANDLVQWLGVNSLLEWILKKMGEKKWDNFFEGFYKGSIDMSIDWMGNWDQGKDKV